MCIYSVHSLKCHTEELTSGQFCTFYKQNNRMDKIERERAAHTSFIILRSTSDLVDIIFKWVLYLPIQILTVFQWNGWNENWKLYFERIYYKHVFYLHFSYTIFTYTHTIFTFIDSRIEWCNRLSFFVVVVALHE